MTYSPPHPKPHPPPHRKKIDEVVAICLHELRGLHSRKDIEVAIGRIIVALLHSQHTSSTMALLNEVLAGVNHYQVEIEPRGY